MLLLLNALADAPDKVRAEGDAEPSPMSVAARLESSWDFANSNGTSSKVVAGNASAAPGSEGPLVEERVVDDVSSVDLPWYRRPWPKMTQMQKLLAGVTFAVSVKTACMVGNLMVQVSPIPLVQRWESRRCTGEADAAPYVSIAFCGWQWCYYGLFAWAVTKRSGFLILVHSNCLGAVLGTYYCLAFWRHCRKDAMMCGLHKYLLAALTLVLLQVCALALLPLERSLFLTGLVSSFCSFVGAVSMLFCVPGVLRSQDSRPIPGLLCFANFLSAAVWILCGWMLADPLIMIPNATAAMSSLACLYLKWVFRDGDQTAGLKQSGLEHGEAVGSLHSSECTPLVQEEGLGPLAATGGTF